MNKLTKIQKLIFELVEPAIEGPEKDFLRLDVLIGEILRLYICLVKRDLGKENIPFNEGTKKLNDKLDGLMTSAKFYSMVVEGDSSWARHVDKLNLTFIGKEKQGDSNIPLEKIGRIVGGFKHAKIKGGEYVEARKLAEALMDMVDDYGEKSMYANLGRQPENK